MKPGKVHLDAQVTWLVCSSVCMPGKAHLGLDVDVVPGPVPRRQPVGALGTAMAALPKPLPATMSASAVGDAKQILVTLKTGTQETDAEFYPFDQEVIENAAEQPVESQPDGDQDLAEARGGCDDAAEDAAWAGGAEPTEAYDVTAPVTPGTVPPLPRTAKKTPDTSNGPDLTRLERDWAGVSGRADSEPDALRVPGAVFEGAGAGALVG